MSLPDSSAKYRTPEYATWASMHARCKFPSATGYANYGGRGIAVCSRWAVFEAFLEDMGRRPVGFSLDRIDNDADYSPANCRWVHPAEQRRNQRDLLYLEHNGKRQCAAVWAREMGIPYPTLRARVRAGWDSGRALMTPVRQHKPYARRAA